MVGDFDDETNFIHQLLLTNRQIENLHIAFKNQLMLSYQKLIYLGWHNQEGFR